MPNYIPNPPSHGTVNWDTYVVAANTALDNAVAAQNSAFVRRMAGATNGAALSTALSVATPGTVLRFDAGSYTLNGGPYAVPDGVTVLFNPGVTISANAGLFMLGNGAAVRGGTFTGTGTAEANLIDLGVSKADQVVKDVTATAWVGVAVYGVAAIRPNISRVRGTCTRNGSTGCLVLLTTGSTGDVVEPTLTDVRATGCGGTGVQLDGQWNSATWRTTGYKVRSPRLTRVRGTGCGFGGVFVNSAVDGVLDGCSGDSNGDYGVGLEYCQDSIMIGCRGRSNATLGLALEANNERCTIVGGGGSNNTQHGIWVNYDSTRVVGDTPGSGNAVIGTTNTGNIGNGINIGGGPVGTTIRGNSNTGNTAGAFSDGGVQTVTDGSGVPNGARMNPTRWYAPGTGRGAASFGNGLMTAVPLQVGAAGKIAGLSINVTSSGSVGSVIRLGVYSDAQGLPGTLLLDAGTVSGTGAAGAVGITGLTLSVRPGTYWLAAVPQGAPTTSPTLTNVSGASGLADYDSNGSALAGGAGWYVTGVTGALPGTFGSPSLSTGPYVVAAGG